MPRPIEHSWKRLKMEKKPAATCHFTDASQAARGLGPNRCLWLRPGSGGVSRDSDSDNQRHETEQKRTNYIRVGEALTVPRQRASGRRTCWYSHMARLVSTQDTLRISAQAKTRLGLVSFMLPARPQAKRKRKRETENPAVLP